MGSNKKYRILKLWTSTRVFSVLTGRSNSLVIKPLDSGARYFGLKLHLHHLPVLFALDS